VNSTTLLKSASIVAGLMLWHVISEYIVRDTSMIVSPLTVVRTGHEMLFINGELYPHLFASSWIFFMASCWPSWLASP
jgi:ABC-type nitrate/sulfonate/bicarbonate transport system permease component